MTTQTTPMEALRRLLDASKQIDFADCKDERVWQALGVGQAVAEGVLRDYVEPEVEQFQARLDAKEARNKMLLSELDALSARYFHEGVPPAHFGKEWFIAVMYDGDKVVLRSLDEENAYDYTTMDATYFKAYRIKKWMQFPDSQYITYVGAAPVAQPAAEKECTVLHTELAHKIITFFGRATSPSMEPGADPFADRLAEKLAAWVGDIGPAIAAPTEVERDAVNSLQRYEESDGEGGGVYPSKSGQFVKLSDVIAAIATGEKA